MNKKIEVKKVIKTIELNKNDLRVLNSVRLDLIKRIEHLKENVKLCKNYSLKIQRASKKDLNNFIKLYDKLFSNENTFFDQAGNINK